MDTFYNRSNVMVSLINLLFVSFDEMFPSLCDENMVYFFPICLLFTMITQEKGNSLNNKVNIIWHK